MPKKQKTTRQLLEENIQLNNTILKDVSYLKKVLIRGQIMAYFRFIIILTPIILAILYFLPIAREFLKIYEPLIDLLSKFNDLNPLN